MSDVEEGNGSNIGLLSAKGSFDDVSPETVRYVLNKLEGEAQKKVSEGFNPFNFAFGVANTHLIVYMWAVYPQHFWILYLIEAGFFLTFRFLKLMKKKPLNQALHYLDFCWVTNIACFIFLCIVLFVGGHSILFSELFRQEFFNLAFGVACGPLFGALIVTPLPLLFHSNEIMASVFIHFFPPLQLYILRWNSAVMKEVWPTFWFPDFDFLYFWPRQGFFGSVFGNSLIFYFAWAIPYMIFQLSIGLDLPRQNRRSKDSSGRPKLPKYDTVYHYNMRGGQTEWMGKLFWGRSKEESLQMNETNEYELRDFFMYMFIHFFGVFISIVILAFSCSLSKFTHAAWIFGVFIAVILRGANRYVFYSTEMYAKILRQQFKDLLLEEPMGIVNNEEMLRGNEVDEINEVEEEDKSSNEKVLDNKEKGLDKVVGLEDENEAGPSLIPDKDDIYNENSGEKSQDDEDSITKKMENCD